MRKLIVLIVMTVAMLGQTLAAKAQTSAASRKPAGTAKSDVDVVIDLVKGGMSESLVIKQLQRQGKVHKLENADLLKLAKAGVTENIINVLMDPSATLTETPNPPVPPPAPPATNNLAAVVAPTPQPAPAPEAPVVTPFPPDLEGVSPARKRRVVISPFAYGAIKDWLQGYFHTTDDVGQGLRALLMSRLQQSNVVTVLERSAILDDEVKRGSSAGSARDTRIRPGRTFGADCVVTGDITIFGRDNKTKKKGFGAGLIPDWKWAAIGGFGVTDKEEKAVVGIEFRIVDTETSEVLLPASARGESVRKSKSLGIEGLGIGREGAAGGTFQSAMTSSGFEKTILGEATIDAVNKIVKQIEEKVPHLPAKPRSIEGRVAQVSANGVYLALGSDDGVLLGDRFEIRQINNEVLDPQTKDPIALEAVKVGELVVHEVEGKSALGAYGGQQLSPATITGKGYQARLMTK